MTAFMPDAHTLFTSVQLAADDSPAWRAACRPGACKTQQASLKHLAPRCLPWCCIQAVAPEAQQAPLQIMGPQLTLHTHFRQWWAPGVQMPALSLSLALHEHLLKPAAATGCHPTSCNLVMKQSSAAELDYGADTVSEVQVGHAVAVCPLLRWCCCSALMQRCRGQKKPGCLQNRRLTCPSPALMTFPMNTSCTNRGSTPACCTAAAQPRKRCETHDKLRSGKAGATICELGLQLHIMQAVLNRQTCKHNPVATARHKFHRTDRH